MRREPEDGLLAPYDTEGQYRLHEALLRLGGVPVPGLRWLELDPSVLGMPFYVMDRVDGHVPVQWKPDDPIAFPDEAARRVVGEQFVDALAAIHALDWRATGLAAEPRDEVAHWERLLDEAVLVEVPLLREAIAWLRANPASSGRVALVHGDYRIGNFILGSDRRIAAVLDWELAHAGDPVEDIAWAGLRLFRGRSSLWSQLLPAEFLARYEERTGLHVDPEVLRYFTVLCTLRTSSRTCAPAAPSRRAARATCGWRRWGTSRSTSSATWRRSWRHDPELPGAAAGRRRRAARGHRAAAGRRVRARAGAGGRGDPREPRPARAVARGRRRGRDRVRPPALLPDPPRRAIATTTCARWPRRSGPGRARWTSRSRCSSARWST